MKPLTVEGALLRAILTPELNLTVGRELVARVASTSGNGRGQISLAGILLDAELPQTVSTGDELRLAVKEVTAAKVVLAMQQGNAAAQPPPVQADRMPLPSGGFLQVTERDAGAAAASSNSARTLQIRYDAPALGAVVMIFTLRPASLQLELQLPAGAPHTLAKVGTPELTETLAAASRRQVQITVSARREPLEVYA
ncbi:MAG: hypothetical protein ACP5H2_11455 [Solirubrobacteraceae bacterium]